MDTGLEAAASDSLVISGLGSAIGLPCDSDRFLKIPKNRKFMGGQDHLAVCAAGKALESAGLNAAKMGPKAGLFLAVGYIPFDGADIEALITNSLDGDRISLSRFGTAGFEAVNPLLTFRCLPNMPAYHVSACFDIQGEYFVTYPGPGQFYAALEEASDALASSRVEIALVGAVAHQTNFLVTRHFERIRPSVAREDLRDGAGFVVLEGAGNLRARGGTARGKLLNLASEYTPHDPFDEELRLSERFDGCTALDGEFGVASLPVTLGTVQHAIVRHELRARDGIIAGSVWELP